MRTYLFCLKQLNAIMIYGYVHIYFVKVNTDAVMYTQEVTWPTARRICENAGGTLSGFDTVAFKTYFESIWTGISKFWTDYHSEKYVRKLKSKPFPTDIQRENTFCVYAVYEDRKLKWSTEPCDARHSFLCFHKSEYDNDIRNGILQRHKNQVILHESVLKYVEQIHRVYDCREELYKLGQRGYFVGGYEYNSENSSCRIIEYISLVNYDNNTFLPSNSTDTYLYTSSKLSVEINDSYNGIEFVTGNQGKSFAHLNDYYLKYHL
ncbi:Hypothetical predicted protein [Mytilus galloprovincialis]|uniref:C-type lectin domain-containing protein n=1 Tax=Mytilus galloprovincialis TaxID=29158 RepID=A0A8B6DTJ0_MYTGA|nr:Hypothetical predicted protein [Mytilus galloprovincialis]